MPWSRLVAAALLMCTPLFPAHADEPVWFVVAEINDGHGDSFLLPLTDPDEIAAARVLVAQGPGAGVGSIVAARIAPGGDGFNRDVKQGDKLWSWHVAEFEGFFDMTIELCDGWPGFIEQDVEAFIDNTQSRICFWSYTVVAELEAAPAFAIGDGLDGAWYNPATAGQGVFFDVFPDRRQVGIGWYTFAPEAAGAQRWWTGAGDYSGATATLDLHLTEGGGFATADPVQTTPAGSASVQFLDCNNAILTYVMDAGPSGSMALQRIVPANGCFRR